MKAVFSAACMLGAASAFRPVDPVRDLWEQFKLRWNKRYSVEEELRRFKTWCETLGMLFGSVLPGI